jgi:glycosyltransferase involved in cell wall biosynthesis
MNLIFDNVVFSLQKSGGISVYWKELISRALIDTDYSLSFIEYDNQNFFRKDISIPAELFESQTSSYLPTQVKRYLNPNLGKQEGVFHSSYYRVAKNSELRNISTLHDFTYEFFVKGLPKIIHHYQKSSAIRQSAGIICVSENTKKDLLSFFPKTKESKIRVIYNGVNKNFKITKDSDNAYQALKIPYSGGEFLIYIGDRLSEYKNFPLAVKTCRLVQKPLLIVGGSLLSKKEKELLALELGTNNYFHMLNVSVEKLNVLYNQALCLIYPSSYEGFGIPVIEAQGAGCPVICNKNSSIPEVAGEGALFVDKPDSDAYAYAVRQIISNSVLRNNLIDNGLRNSGRFSWDNTYLQTKDFYKEVYYSKI